MLFKNTRLFFSRAGMSHYPGSGAGRRVSEGRPTARCNSDCTNSQARSSLWEGDTSRRDFPRAKVVGRSQLAHINPPLPPPPAPPPPQSRRERPTNLSKRQISTGCLRLLAAKKKKKSGARRSAVGTAPEMMRGKESLLVAAAARQLWIIPRSRDRDQE